MTSTTTSVTTSDVRTSIVRGLPVAAAIGVFGVIYGAISAPVVGSDVTVASSVVMFSGAAQFAMVALVDGGAGKAAVVTAVSLLALRHVALAAVVRPRLPERRAWRALLGLALIDETVGLAVSDDTPAATTLAVTGALAWAAWVVGTVAGVLGANLAAAESLASVVFLLLFIGLTALTCRHRRDVSRAVVASVATAGLVLVVPSSGALGAILVATAVAALAGERST